MASKDDNTAQLKLTLVKSAIGRLKNHKDCIRGLGLRRINSSVVVKATPSNMGMINKISYLLKIEEM